MFIKCKQCGINKPAEQFRKYYGGRKGHYKTCLDCERINSRYKYLHNKQELSQDESNELIKIEELYTVQRKHGLKPPHTIIKKASITDAIDAMLNEYSDKPIGIPDELNKWLNEPLTKEPEYYDEVYDRLKKTYRPVLKLTEEFMPIYDDTYKEILDNILTRFCEYEDSYY